MSEATPFAVAPSSDEGGNLLSRGMVGSETVARNNNTRCCRCCTAHRNKWIAAGLVFVVLVILIVVFVPGGRKSNSGGQTECVAAAPDNIHRLPHTVRPMSYDLLIAPNFNALAMSGTVHAAFEILQPTSCIVMHAYNMTVTNAVITFPDTSVSPSEMISLSADSIAYDRAMNRQWITITFNRALPVSPSNVNEHPELAAQLSLDYTGMIRTIP